MESTSLPYIPDVTQEPAETISGAPRFSVDLVNVVRGGIFFLRVL